MLWLYKRVVFGKAAQIDIKSMSDLNKIEMYIFTSLIFLTLFFGIYPDPLLNTIDVSINNLIDKHQIEMKFYLGDRNI